MSKKKATKEGEAINATSDKSRSKDRHKPRRNISLPPNLHSKLKELARRNHRPLLWEVTLALENHIRANLSGE